MLFADGSPTHRGLSAPQGHSDKECHALVGAAVWHQKTEEHKKNLFLRNSTENTLERGR